MNRVICLITFVLVSLSLRGQELDKIYTIVDKNPELEGGFGKYLKSELRFPNEIREKGISGTVYIQFVIDTIGNVDQIKVLKGMGYGCDKEAVRFIKSTSGKWIPGEKDNRKVKVQKMYPIKFRIGKYIDGYFIEDQYSEDYEWGIKLIKENRYKKALPLFSAIVDKSPRCNGARYNRGVVYLHLDSLDLACKDWSKCKALGDEKAQAKLSLFCNKINDVEEISEEEEVFTKVDEIASFPGGTNELFKFLNENIKYPYEAKANGIQGKVYTNFVIDEKGNINNIRILRSVHPLLDTEAIRVVKNMPKWIPAKQDGKPVSVSFNLPIGFFLAGETPTTVSSYFSGGTDFLKSGDLEKALKLFTKSIKKYPNHIDSYYNRGITYLKLKDKESACNDWEKCIELGKGDKEVDELLKKHCSQ